MIVVADTSPLNYLVQLGLDSLLVALYGQVATTPTVMAELSDAAAPQTVQAWALEPPLWLMVAEPPPMDLPGLNRLDAGEESTIRLALHSQADLMLIDERRATRIAQDLGPQVTGTLGVLRDAHLRRLIDGGQVYERLKTETTFRHNEAVDQMFLQLLYPFKHLR